MDGALAERLEVDDAADGAADEALDLDRAASRSVRSPVEAGSSEYSAVTQPRPLRCSQRGTFSTTLAVQRTRVRPCDQSTIPCGCSRKSGSASTALSWSGRRPSGRVISAPGPGQAGASARP
jgi:hypothetical protein